MPKNITNEELGLVVGDLTLTRVCDVSATEDDKRAGNTKQVALNVEFKGVTLREVFMGAMSPTVIKWQRAARARYTKLGKAETIHYQRAGQRDPIEAALERAKTMSKDQLNDYMKQLKAIAAADNAK